MIMARWCFSLCLLSILDTLVMQAQDGWSPLLNHRDLSGWEHVGPGAFVVEDGMLKTKGGMGLLWYSERKIGDAILRLSFQRTHPRADSGVFIRIPEKPSEPFMPLHRGYEIEIGDWPEDYSCTGALYTFTNALARPERPAGEWNTMEITLDGPRTVVFVNGVKVTDYTEGQPVLPKNHPHDPDRGPRPEWGYIGLQNYSEDSVVMFREVSVKSLHKNR